MELCLSCTNPSIWYQQKRHKTTTNALKLHLLCINSLWPSGDMDLGQRGLRYWLAATWHQAITWTNDSERSCGIQLRAISQEILKIYIPQDIYFWYVFKNNQIKITAASSRGQWVKPWICLCHIKVWLCCLFATCYNSQYHSGPWLYIRFTITGSLHQHTNNQTHLYKINIAWTVISYKINIAWTVISHKGINKGSKHKIQILYIYTTHSLYVT